MATVASTNPPVLMAHLAASTNRIRIGSGGVMLPNHAPLVVAEQFALLEALHPGRIDLGIGRAPGSDLQTARALRRTTDLRAEDFPRDLLDVMGLLGDARTDDGLWRSFRATPEATSTPQVVLLGSSDFSAQLAGMLGLPFGFAHHFDMGGTLDAVGIYRRSFRPSHLLDRPHVLVTASVLAAEDDATALWLGGPAQLRKYGMRTGRLLSLLTPEAAAEHPEMAAANAMPSTRIIGSVDHVLDGLVSLAAATDADELMLHTSTHGLHDRLASLEAVAAAWPGLRAPAAAAS
jgi:luciferase family oxidoreductase group 1